MITIFNLIIAIIISPFFIKRSHTLGDKVIYFILCVAFTSLVGPFVYKLLTGPTTTNDHSDNIVGGDAWL